MNIISEPEENYKTGWIRLFRSLENHWIWSNEKYLKTWIWFLFRANHKTSKILFSGELIELNRGEFITSLKNISESANLTVQETRHFLKLLEKDEMILKNSNTLATKINICNYESYQDLQQTNNKPTTNQQQTNNKPTTTDNNVKNYNNEEEEYIYSKFYDFELSQSNNDSKYLFFIKFIYGQNETKEKLSGLLSIQKQLTFEQFNQLLEKSKINGIKLMDIVTKIENDKKYWKGKKSLYLTMNNWIENRFIK